MAGVYTDNQPDFSYFAPYETKTFSQFWWPIQGIGPVQQANERAALHMTVRDDRMIELGVCVSERVEMATLVIIHGGEIILRETFSLNPGEAWTHDDLRFAGENPVDLKALLEDKDGEPLLVYRPVDETSLTRDRVVATEPAAPDKIASADELYFTGEHLEQYRHPTRAPELYWQEALRRDDGDVRCNLAMGRRALKSGRLDSAEQYLRKAVARLTRRHPNPETGEAHYFLGLTLFYQGYLDEAYGVLAKAAWNYAWRCAALYQIACIDCRRGDFTLAGERLSESISLNGDHHKAQALLAVIFRQD